MCFWHLKLISIEWPIESTKSNSTSCTFVYKPLIATCWKLARWFGTRAAPRNLLGTTAGHKLSPAAQTRAKRFLNPTRACELPRPSSSFSLPPLDQTSCSYSLPSLPYEYHIRCLMCQITKTHVPRWTSSVTYTHIRPSSNVPPYEGSATLMAKPVTRILRGSYLDFLPQGVSSTVDRHGWPGCVFLYGSCPDGEEERPAVSFDPKWHLAAISRGCNPVRQRFEITQPESRADRARLQMWKEDMVVFIDAIKAISTWLPYHARDAHSDGAISFLLPTTHNPCGLPYKFFELQNKCWSPYIKICD